MTRRLMTVKLESEPAVQSHWDRQRATAAHILDRFEEGHDVQLLGDEVGMGKTYVALAVMAERLLRSRDNSRRALLVTPASSVLRTKWEQEIRSFSEKYVAPGRRELTPLQVNSYWDLVANLHDYQNHSSKNVTSERQRCLLEVTWQWFAARKASATGKLMRTRWPILEQSWKSDAAKKAKESEMVRFVSDFSIAAWHAFLDDQNASQRGQVIDMLARGGQMWEDDPQMPLGKLKELFRDFVRCQDAYEPNVFIIPMSALGMPKRNSSGTRRFATFVLATLLISRWDETRGRCLKAMKGDDILIEKVTIKMLKEMSGLDLYNTRHCVSAALEAHPDLATRWDDIVNGRAGNIPATFKAILAAVVAQKLRESGIDLAVVDEVHNWKGRTNGAVDFRTGFAPHVPHKLIMSATPFQLEEREMQHVFENVARRDGKTWQTLQALYGSNIVADCLAANANLMQALRGLAQHRIADDVLPRLALRPELLQAKLQTMAVDPMASEAAALFCRLALDYRAAVDKLVARQRELVVRHLKTDLRRSVHAGIDFGGVSPVHRPTLYPTSGINHPDDQLVNYLAMRLNQRMRRDGSSAKAKAHLLGGMTSSLAAFRDSAQATRSTPNMTTSSETARYAEMVNSVLEQHRHPKVEATVAHALQNYSNGKKTLIFCERLATVGEIAHKIAEGIEADWKQVHGQDVAAGGDVREREAFVDLPLGRLLLSMTKPAGEAGTTVELRAGVASFVSESLRSSGLEPTQRRMMRLCNLYLLAVLPSDETRASSRLCERLVTLFERRHMVDELNAEVLTGRRGQAFVGELGPRVAAFVDAQFAGERNLWIGSREADESRFVNDVINLLESEAKLVLAADAQGAQSKVTIGFAKTLLDLEGGLKSVLLRPDLLRGIDATGDDLETLAHARVRAPLGQGGESAWSRMTRFVSQLVSANGTINVDDQKSTERKSLWRAISLRGVRTDDGSEPLVQTLTGSTKAQPRVAVCAAFNSPLAPDVLICTSIGSEGIDLHRECAEIIHHDMPWNPARLEQRNGRIDRVASLSKATGCHVRIGVPFLEQSYERFQFDRLLSRAQLFQVLLCTLDFDATDVDQDNDEETMPEPDPDAAADMSDLEPLLPEALAKWLSVDLSVWQASQVRVLNPE
jgi:hypothetical protein